MSDTNREHGQRHEFCDCTNHAMTKKALISCAVIAQLTCVFGFTNAKSPFFHNQANMMLVTTQLPAFLLEPCVHESCRDLKLTTNLHKYSAIKMVCFAILYE